MALRNTSRHRRWVFTLNNWSQQEYDNLRALKDVKAAIIGKERGEQGTPHLQGAMAFTRAITLKTMKTLVPRAHLEPMKGSLLEAFDYCKKEGNFIQWGDVPNPGKRNDLKHAIEQMKSGKRMKDIVEETDSATVFVKYSRGLNALQNLYDQNKPLNKKTVVWLHGHTGAGKTYSAVQFCKDNDIDYWISGDNLKWFDLYTGQDVVIFDDFRWNHCSFSSLLRLLDQYELNVQIKGGYVRWNPKIIFVTTPKSIAETFVTEWRQENSEDLQQVKRRVHMVLEMPRDKYSPKWKILKLKMGISVDVNQVLIPETQDPLEVCQTFPVLDLDQESNSEAVDEEDQQPFSLFCNSPPWDVDTTLDYQSQEDPTPW